MTPGELGSRGCEHARVVLGDGLEVELVAVQPGGDRL